MEEKFGKTYTVADATGKSIRGVSKKDYLAFRRGEKTIDDLVPIAELLALKPPPPSKAAIAQNLAQAMKEAVASGFKFTSIIEQESRYSICKTDCLFYDGGYSRCLKCGCFVKFKSKLEAWHCPIGKW